MDLPRPIAILVPLGTWPTKRQRILREQGAHFTIGFAPERTTRLRTLLLRTWHAVLDLFHT